MIGAVKHIEKKHESGSDFSDNDSGPESNHSGYDSDADEYSHEQSQRHDFENKFAKILDDSQIEFTKSVINDGIHRFKFTYENPEGKRLDFRYGRYLITVSHDLGNNFSAFTCPINQLKHLYLDVHDLCENSLKHTNTYNLAPRNFLYNKFSMHFFKCLYKHGNEIADDLLDLSQ